MKPHDTAPRWLRVHANGVPIQWRCFPADELPTNAAYMLPDIDAQRRQQRDRAAMIERVRRGEAPMPDNVIPLPAPPMESVDLTHEIVSLHGDIDALQDKLDTHGEGMNADTRAGYTRQIAALQQQIDRLTTERTAIRNAA